MVSEIELERIANGISLRLSSELLADYAIPVDVSLRPDPFSPGEAFVLQMVTRAYGRMLTEKYVRYPKTWWDAFKEQVLPYWIRKRVEIKYTTKKIEVRELYPSIPGNKSLRICYEVRKV